MRVTVREKLVVGFGELIPVESGADNSAKQYISTGTNNTKKPAVK